MADFTGLPAPNALVLVTLLKEPRDLEIARLLGWYRIPLRSAPRVVAVDYLAFYQTAAFGEQRWQVEYVAPVRGHELTTRGELLRDEPHHPHAGHEYYKIQIGPLARLPQPVRAEKWRRMTFLYTTGEYLLRAHTLHDLVLQDEERLYVWQALRERMEAHQRYQAAPAEIELTPEVLAALLGIPGGQAAR
ncbi:MAG: hypothetical protein ACKOC5_04070 [Chloroflexota bacterium]